MKIIISIAVLILFFTSTRGQLWQQYADSATAYTAQNTSKAIEFSIKSKDLLKKDSLGTLTYASACTNLAILYNNIGQYEKAEPLYIETQKIDKKLLGNEDAYYANACFNLAFLYTDMVQYAKAEQLYREVMQIHQKPGKNGDPEYALASSGLAGLYFKRGIYEKAEQLCIEAMTIQEKQLGKENPDYAITCGNLANVYTEMGQYEKAEQLSLQVKKIQEKVLGKENGDYATTCESLATVYYRMGQYEKAEPLYLEAVKIYQAQYGKLNTFYAISCNARAVLYQDIGLYAKAEQLYLEAKQTQEKVTGKGHPDYAAFCNNLANLYQLLGQYNKAEPLYIETKQILEKLFGKRNPLNGNALNNLALIYFYTGQYAKAEPLYLEAKKLREDLLGKNHPDYASSCNNLALFYFNTGQYSKVEPLFAEAKRVRLKTLGKRHPDYGLTCANLAGLYWLQHKPQLAELGFKESFAVNKNNLSSVFQFTNEKEKASFIKNILGEDDKAYSFYLSANVKSALPYSMSLFHRNLILSSTQALTKELFSASDTSLRKKYNEWLRLKKYLSVLYSKPVDERNDDVTAIEARAGVLETDLVRLSSGFKKQQQKVDWNDIKNSLQPGEASVEFASFHFNNGKLSTDTIFYVALVLKKDLNLPSLIYLFNEKQLAGLLAGTGNKTTNDGVKELYASRGITEDSNVVLDKSIYQLIWKPLEKELKGIKTVYFAPSGMLHRIAFAALPINKKEVLSDRYKLVQLATTASVIDKAPAFIGSADNLQLYGGIKYDADAAELKKTILSFPGNIKKDNTRSLPGNLSRRGSFNYLPGTKAEIDMIEKQGRTSQKHISLLSGIKATEESFKALDGKASPSVIHIATHGFFFPDPAEDEVTAIQRSFESSGRVFRQSDNPLFRSGLLFAGANNAWKGNPIAGIEDGILTAYEVSNMYLPNTRLVVLSACETALGDIQGSEGVYGLQRAFKIAGVQNLVMSLWKVPDIETGEFMQLFYKNMYAGKSISDAFYLAQTGMKNKYRNDPYKWAAWVMVR